MNRALLLIQSPISSVNGIQLSATSVSDASEYVPFYTILRSKLQISDRNDDRRIGRFNPLVSADEMNH